MTDSPEDPKPQFISIPTIRSSGFFPKPDFHVQGRFEECCYLLNAGLTDDRAKQDLLREFRPLAIEGGLLLGGTNAPEAIDAWLTRIRNVSPKSGDPAIRHLLSASIDYLTGDFRPYQIAIGDWAKAGRCESLAARFEKLRAKFFDPPYGAESFSALVGTSEVEGRKFERGRRLVESRKRWQQHVPFTWIHKAAKVGHKEATQWKNGHLPDGSAPCGQIERVLRELKPPTKPPSKR